MSATAMRKVAPRRTHRERSQVGARKHLGLLEKHKDYVQRARDFHRKEDALRALREKAAMRNPDEFYHKMIRSRTKGGVHLEERNLGKLSAEELKLMNTQDIKYLQTRLQMERRKIEKLEESVPMMGHDLALATLRKGGNNNNKKKKKQEQQQEKDMQDDQPPRASHRIFVDSEQELRHFKPHQHFDTHQSLMDDRLSRQRMDTLRQMGESEVVRREEKKLGGRKRERRRAGPSAVAQLSEQSRKQRARLYSELDARTAREQKIRKVADKLTLQKHLMGKGKRKRVKKAEGGKPAVFKWSKERKK